MSLSTASGLINYTKTGNTKHSLEGLQNCTVQYWRQHHTVVCMFICLHHPPPTVMGLLHITAQDVLKVCLNGGGGGLATQGVSHRAVCQQSIIYLWY